MAETLAWNFVGNDEITGLLERMDRVASKLDRVLDGVGRSATGMGRQMAAAERQVDKLGDEMAQAGRQADDFVDELDGITVAGGQLNIQIEVTKKKIKELVAEFDRTGDRNLLGDLRLARSDLASLIKAAGELADAGAEAGTAVTKGFIDALGALPSQLRGALYVGIAGLAVSLAPLLGAAVSAAVVGGVGAGGVIGGIALAARDPAVKTAAGQFAAQVVAAFDPIGDQFAKPVIDALDIMGDAAQRVADSLDLGQLTKQIPALAAGLGDFAEEIMPGLNKALDTGGRIIGILSNELGDLGDALGDALGAMADEEGTVLGFIYLLELVEATVRATGQVMAWLGARFHDLVSAAAAVTGVMEDLYGWLPIVGDAWGSGNDRLEEMLTNLNLTPEQVDAVINGFNDLGGASADLAGNLDEATDAFGRLFGKWMSVDEARIAVEQAIDDIAESFDKNGSSLDLNKEKGRQNVEQLLRGVRALEQERQAMIDNGTSIAYANEFYDKQYKRLVDNAVAHGAVRAEIRKVIGEYETLTKMSDITKRVRFVSDTSDYRPPPTAGGRGGLYAYQGGGEVGPGLPRGTMVPILAHAGELVVPEDLADRLLGLSATPRPASAPLPAGLGAGAAGGPAVLELHLTIVQPDGRAVTEAVKRYAVQTGRRRVSDVLGLEAA